MDFYIEGCGEISKEDKVADVNRMRYQSILSSIKTTKGEWISSLNFGSDIEKYIGSNKKHLQTINAEILESLTEDGFLNKNDLFLEVFANESLEMSMRVYVKDIYKDVIYEKIDVKVDYFKILGDFYEQ